MATIIPFDQLAPMLRVIPSLPRPILARLTDKLIERLDELDGDGDLEPNGDELDHTDAEDEPIAWRFGIQSLSGAGCPISDPDGVEEGV